MSDYWLNIFGMQSMHGHTSLCDAIQEIEDYGAADYVTTVHIVDDEFIGHLNLLARVHEKVRNRKEETEHERQERWSDVL